MAGYNIDRQMIDRQQDEWMDKVDRWKRWKNSQMERTVDRKIDLLMAIRTDAFMDGWMIGQMEGMVNKTIYPLMEVKMDVWMNSYIK